MVIILARSLLLWQWSGKSKLVLCLRPWLPLRLPLVRLVDGGVSLGAEAGGRRAALEVSAEGRGKEGAEDNLGTTGLKSALEQTLAIGRGQLTGTQGERATGGRQT